MSDENPVRSWSGIVPEFYYDLISRIPPGIFLFLSLLFVLKVFSFDKISEFKDNGAVVAVLTLLLFIGGYALGIFLSALGSIIAGIYSQLVFKKQSVNFKDLLKKYIKHAMIYKDTPEDIGNLPFREYVVIFRRLQDFLRYNNMEARTVLPKMNAEASLSNNTIVALVILSIVYYIHKTIMKQPFDSYDWWWLAIVISICGILGWIGYNRYTRLIAREFSFLCIVLEKGKVAQSP